MNINKSNEKLDQIFKSVVEAKQYKEPEKENKNYYLVNIGSSHFEPVEKRKDLRGRDYYMDLDDLLDGVYDPLTKQDLLDIKSWVDANSDFPLVRKGYFILQLSLKESMSCMLSDLCVTKQYQLTEESENLRVRLDTFIEELMEDPYCFIPKAVLASIVQHAKVYKLKAFYYQDEIPYTIPSIKLELTFAYLRFLSNILVKRVYISAADEFVPYSSVNTVNPNTAFLLTEEEKSKYFVLPTVSVEEEKDENEDDEDSSDTYNKSDYLEFVREKSNKQYEIYTIEYIMSQVEEIADKYVKFKGGEEHNELFHISYEGPESLSISLWSHGFKETPRVIIDLEREPYQKPLVQIEFDAVHSILLSEYLVDNFFILDDKYCINAKDFIKEDNLKNIFDRLIWQRYVDTHK